jgi:hypothetical protein
VGAQSGSRTSLISNCVACRAPHLNAANWFNMAPRFVKPGLSGRDRARASVGNRRGAPSSPDRDGSKAARKSGDRIGINIAAVAAEPAEYLRLEVDALGTDVERQPRRGVEARDPGPRVVVRRVDLPPVSYSRPSVQALANMNAPSAASASLNRILSLPATSRRASIGRRRRTSPSRSRRWKAKEAALLGLGRISNIADKRVHTIRITRLVSLNIGGAN